LSQVCVSLVKQPFSFGAVIRKEEAQPAGEAPSGFRTPVTRLRNGPAVSARVGPLKHGPRRGHAERLVRLAVVVEPDPIAITRRMCLRKTVVPNAPLQRFAASRR